MSGLSRSEAPTTYSNANENASATFLFQIPGSPLELDWHVTGKRWNSVKIYKNNVVSIKEVANKFMQICPYHSTC
jgi:hypothetical protein